MLKKLFKSIFKKSFFSLFLTFFFSTLCVSHAKDTNHTKNVVFKKALDQSQIVVKTKLVKFNEDISNAYNGSILEQNDGYLLVFRHDTTDVWCKECSYKKPQIKMVSLNKKFQQINPIKTILPDTSFSEDARLHYLSGKLFLTFNDDPMALRASRSETSKSKGNKNYARRLRYHSHPARRRLFIGKLSPIHGHLSGIKRIPPVLLRLAPVEKNWTPFEYPEQSGNLYYIYTTSPYQIIKVGNVNNKLESKILPIIEHRIDDVWQKDAWGEIRGGSPARLVDGVYITFFHSWKRHTGCWYYVMGAYAFEAKPPFKVLAITPHPIIFDEMYSAPHRIKKLHALYPAGFAIERKGKKTLLHVSCGENDTSIRIVTIDKKALFRAMVPFVE